MTFCIHDFKYIDFNHRTCKKCGLNQYYSYNDNQWINDFISSPENLKKYQIVSSEKREKE